MIVDVINVLMQRSDLFIELLIEHIAISTVVIVTAIVLGGVVGILISEYSRVVKPTFNVVNFLYTIPSISMLGFLIPMFGVGNSAAIVALTIYALLPIVRNTYTGLTQVNRGIIEAAIDLGLNRRQIIFHIKLPIAMPIIMTGIRNMVVMTISLAGIASFIGAGGLGVAIYRGITTNNAAMTMAGSLLIALMALISDYLLGLLEKRFNYQEEYKSKVNWKLVAGLGILILIGSLVSGVVDKKETIHIATKPMTEQYILGEMLKFVIERDTDLEVELTTGVGGGTSNIQPAMESGEFDIYPEYTGTAWNMVLKRKALYNESMFEELSVAYQNNYQMRWLGMYGFNDTYGLVVRREIAEQYDLKTFSDLKRVANQLTFGAEYDFFEREDGYAALCKAYQFNFGKTMDLDIGLKYKAIANNQIDVMVIFTTDGQLSQADAIVLADDLQFFPSYMCGNVVREEVLTKYPELEATLNKFTNIITDSEMAQLNYQVETEGKEPAVVAKELATVNQNIDK